MREREKKKKREESENRRMTLAERRGGRMAGKGGRQRERERHTGERQHASPTWPTHIAPTRFLSLADNCTISLHSLVLSSLPPLPPPFRSLRVRFSSSRASPGVPRFSLSHLPSSFNSLILPSLLFHFHALSCCPSCFLHPVSARIYIRT